jgi:CRISPR-associated endonuclease Cas1
MFVEPSNGTPMSADDWAERNENWQHFATSARPARKLRQREPSPLILCGHGVSLRVEGGALAVRDGFTHYPQEQRTHRLFPGDLALPPRIILLDGSGTLSFDVLSWLGEQGIPLARVKWTGEVAAVAGSGCLDRAKVDWQRATRADEAKRLAFAADLIRQKLLASIATLQNHSEPGRSRDVGLSKAETGIERLGSEAFRNINDVFAIEGECASAYFAAWNGLPIAWTGTARKPVPEQWRSYAGRSSLATGVKPENRNASHPANALLNYAYAVKLAHVQIDAVANGYDPMLGIMHNGRKGSPGWALDMIEPHRPVVDGSILSLIRKQRFAAADFIMRRDGVCRLSPQLARAVATLVSAAGAGAPKAGLPGRKPVRQRRGAS